MQSGDLLQWRSESALGWGIRLFTYWDPRKDPNHRRDEEVNHTGGVLQLRAAEGVVDRRFSLESLERGLIPYVLSDRIVGHAGKVWWHPLREDMEQYRDKLVSWLLLRMGTRYDFFGCLRNVVSRPVASALKVYCSEAYFLAAQAAGVPQLQGVKQAPRPSEMTRLGVWKTQGVRLR